jgi:hypothetical protein
VLWVHSLAVAAGPQSDEDQDHASYGQGVIAALITNLSIITQFTESIFGHEFQSRSHKVVKVCMGNGDGNNCLAGADAKFDCNAYNGMGGGSEQTYNTLADRFCGYTENGVRKVDPNDITVYQNNGGGQVWLDGFSKLPVIRYSQRSPRVVLQLTGLSLTHGGRLFCTSSSGAESTGHQSRGLT